MITDRRRHIFEFARVAPNLVKKLKICGCKGRLINTVDDIGNGVTLLISQIHCGETMQGHVRYFLLCSLDTSKLLHWRLGLVRTEFSLATHPLCTFACDGTLGEFVAKLDLKFGAVQAAFAVSLGNKKFSTLFFELVGDLIGNKGWCRENELQRINLCELSL